MHRSEYMAYRKTDTERSEAHRQYYAQYVTPTVRALVLRIIGEKCLRESTDSHFNDIQLRTWDRMVASLPGAVSTALRANGDWLSLGTGVCVLKEAARQIVEGK